MLRKYASLQVLEAWRVPAQAGPAAIRKSAHRVGFDYEPRPGYLYVRSRMISSRTNDNHDTFPAPEIEKGYRSFLGKPVFVNHHNANHRRARGVIVAVALHRDRNPDRTPDTWVEGLMEIDAVRFPKLAQAILAGKVNRTSMGVDVDWSRCSACGNKATSPAEYCNHLPAMKGKKIRKTNPRSGKVEERLIHEICAGLSFFENSLLVEDPADPTAFVVGTPDARGLKGLDIAPRQAGKPDTRGLGKAAVRKTADNWYSGSTHCIGCQRQFGGPRPGNWPSSRSPHLCNDCAGGHVGGESEHGKPPAIEHEWPDMGGRAPSRNLADKAGPDVRGVRQWTPDDALRSSYSAKKREGGDHPFFHDHPVSAANVVAAYHDTTDDEKALGDRWYADAHHVAKAIAGGDAAKGAGLLSAYSPQTAWPVNMFNASRAAQGDPPGPGTGAMGSQQKPAMRILAGEHHSKVLKASKTSAFAHLIEHGGDTPEDEKHGTGKVVVDRHALSVAVGHRLTKEEGQKAPLDQPQHYHHVAQAYREAAHILSSATGRKISPHQVQAATWLRQIRKNQDEDRSGKREVGGRKDIGGGGRVKMHDNSRTRWENHHKQHHPGAIPEDNMHHHGAWTANPDYCLGCAEPLNPDLPGAEPRHKEIPHLCVGCGHDAALDPGGYEMLHDRHRGVGERFQNDIRGFGQGDALRSSMSVRKVAYGETRVPPQVDTLRMEECPVCGEHDVWSGDRCPVCGFVVPPSLFRDPDTSKAQEVRDQLDQSGEVTTGPDGMEQNAPGTGPDGQIGSGDDADNQLMHPDQVTPNGTPAVQGDGGPVPGPDTDGQPGDEEEPGAEGEEDEELPPDDSADPQDGQQEQAEGQQLEEQGEEEQEQGQEDEEQGQELEQQGEEDELEPAEPEDELECPACGAQFAIDGAAQPGVPCPACKMAALVPLEAPGGPPEGAEDPSDPEEEDEGEEEDKMQGSSKTAAALAQAQASRMASLAAENEVLQAQLSFLASAAGVDRYLAQIRADVMRRHADVLNPASPVPDPPEAPPTQTTEEALQSGSGYRSGQNGAPPRGTGHTEDDPSRPGATPGSMDNVPALQTSTAITPGVELQTPPATNLIDVTAPVQGTNPSQDGGVPLEQRRIETDVRINPDPLAAHGPGIGGQGDNGSAFPWMLDARPQQGQGQRAAALHNGGTGEADSSQRTFASIRLAKLRITAGLDQGDELSVAARIERDGALPTQLIEHEIGVLSRMPVTDQRMAARPVQRTAARQVPSLASVGAMQYAPAAMAGDDMDASDIFY